MARRALIVGSRLVAGVALGLALGAGYWALALTLGGHNLIDASQGGVEDGLGMLQGLAALGTLCGAGVGLCWGLAALPRRE
jgi:hypothetical protein